MILYLAITAIAVAFAMGVPSVRERAAVCVRAPRGAVSRRALTGGVLMTGIFLLLFLPLALRINVGNDYARYVEFMHLARFGSYVPTEAGFNFLAWAAFRIFGEENFLFCFAVIAAITVCCFLAAIDRLADRFAWSFLMFMLLGYYFQSYSTVRYYLALSVTTLSLVYLLKRDVPRFVLLVVFAACFHKSALVVLLFYPLAMLRYPWVFYPLFAVFGTAGFLLKSFVLRVVLALYPTYQETGLAEGGEGSLFSIVRCVLVLALALAADRESFLGDADDDDARARRFYCHCSVLALVLYLFFSYVPIVSRIGYYLTITQIFYVPALVIRMPSGTKKRVVAAAAVLICLGFFAWTMRHAGDDGFRILPYQTFVFHEMPPILSDTGY